MMVNNNLLGGIPTPLKNDGVRQLGLLFKIYGKIIQMFQTTNQVGSTNSHPILIGTLRIAIPLVAPNKS